MTVPPISGQLATIDSGREVKTSINSPGRMRCFNFAGIQGVGDWWAAVRFPSSRHNCVFSTCEGDRIIGDGAQGATASCGSVLWLGDAERDCRRPRQPGSVCTRSAGNHPSSGNFGPSSAELPVSRLSCRWVNCYVYILSITSGGSRSTGGLVNNDGAPM